MDYSNIQHLSFQEFMDAINNDRLTAGSKLNLHVFYMKIISNWKTPQEWLRSEEKKFSFCDRSTDSYWVCWSIIRGIPLPVDFIRNMRLGATKSLLKNLLYDYSKWENAEGELRKAYKSTRTSTFLVKVLVFFGFSSYGELKLDHLFKVNENEIITYSQTSTLSKLLYFSGLTDAPLGYRELQIKERKKLTNSYEIWSNELQCLLEQFYKDLHSSKVRSKTELNDKKKRINRFALWYISEYKIDKLTDLKINNIILDKYCGYLSSLDNGPKTKAAILLALIQFIKWLSVKHPEYTVNELEGINLNANRFGNQEAVKSLCFLQREHGEKIIKFLFNDFVADNVQEEFIKEAIIIAANSGMRFSEIRDIEYGCYEANFAKGIYKVRLTFIDKLNQLNRECYITLDGYKAIKRVEQLRKKAGPLIPCHNKKREKSYIHLFELGGANPLVHNSITNLLVKIKVKVGLFDIQENVVKGVMHAFRHYFAMTVFRESGYNLGVVRFLLGHRKYDMTLKYLVEEIAKVTNQVRNANHEEENQYAGKGLDTLINILLTKKHHELVASTINIANFKTLNEMINDNRIKKVPLGYCINPCINANRCIKCNNFIMSKNDELELRDKVRDMFNFICYKITLFNDIEDALSNPIIIGDLAEIEIVLQEMNYLGMDVNELLNSFSGGMN